MPEPPATLNPQADVVLAPLTTIGIGGPAQWLVRATSEAELRECILWCAEHNERPLVLGGGSNVLIADEGWPGIVIQNAIGGVHIESESASPLAIAGGGVNWDEFVAQTVSSNLQGIECLSGIPGTVGASPVQNIGAYGQEVKDTIEWVEVMDRTTGAIVRISAADCGFAYRWSRFKGADLGRYIVTRVAFRLRHGAQPELRYGDLTRYFNDREIESPTLAQVREAVIQVRAAKGMVISPDIPDSRSCGSFFMNPIVSEKRADDVYNTAIKLGVISSADKMPRYPAGSEGVKLSAAWLMEKSGLRKGQTHGSVGLSTRHILAIINCGNGTAAQVVEFSKQIKATVKTTFGIELHPEPVFVGFSANNQLDTPR